MRREEFVCWALEKLDLDSAKLRIPLIDKGIEYARTCCSFQCSQNCSAGSTFGPTEPECGRTGPAKFNKPRVNLGRPAALLYGCVAGFPTSRFGQAAPRFPLVEPFMRSTLWTTPGPHIAKNMRVKVPNPMMST
jgi:hypothetical protein